MARINIEQLRQWQNGDIIPAQDYNQERNLLVEANNDTNDKANLATQNALNALDRASRLELQPTSIQETSTNQRLTLSLSEGQQIIDLPQGAVGYLPNTNRVQVFVNGVRRQITETSSTQVALQSPAIAGDVAIVEWVTELPRIFDIERLQDAVDATRNVWLEPVGVEGQLPFPAEEGDVVAVTSSEKVYRFQNGTWVHIMDAPKILEEGVPKVVQLTKTYTAQANQQTFAMPLNFDIQTDSAFVIRNTTFVPPSGYTLSNTLLTFPTAVKEGDQIVIIAYKAMPIGSEGSVSGLAIAQNSLPVDRIVGFTGAIEQAVQTVESQIRPLSDDLQILYWMGGV